MARKRTITVAGDMLSRGTKMHPGSGWRLVTPNGRGAFKAALVTTFRLGTGRYALVKVMGSAAARKAWATRRAAISRTTPAS
jgi:hypothetical protein